MAKAIVSSPRAGATGDEGLNGAIGHLMRRAGFGASPDEIAAATRAGLPATIDALINYEAKPSHFTPPDLSTTSDGMGMMGRTADITPLTIWWLRTMLTTNRPLQEKMALFWHGHFATANYKVRSPEFMYRQNQLFRNNALGRFDDLLSAVYKDPAMLIWLDGDRNTKQAPNENFGREVMELFTLGHGPETAPNYTEDDVHANARAFTGWRLLDTGEVMFVPRLHDFGLKTLLGHTGNWNGEDAVRILAAHRATGPALATKLWKFFASDTPPAGVVAQMAHDYYASGHSIRSMVRTMFASAEFYSADTTDGHIKSPVEFLVTTLKQLRLTNTDLSLYPFLLTQLGQQLFDPPTVGGWAAGTTWINASTMLTRFNFASRLTGDAPGSQSALDGRALLATNPPATVGQLIHLVTDTLGIAPSANTYDALLRYATGTGLPNGGGSPPAAGAPLDGIDAVTKVRGLVHLALISPEYQIA